MTTTTISERSTGWIFYKRMWKMLLLVAAASGYYSSAAVLLHAWIIITFFGQMTWWDRSKKWLIVSCTRVWGKECYLDILQCGMDLSLTDCYAWRRFQRTTVCAMQYYAHVQNKTENCNYYDWLIHLYLSKPVGAFSQSQCYLICSRPYVEWNPQGRVHSWFIEASLN